MGKKKNQLVLYGESEVNRLIHVVKDESRTTSLRVAEEFHRQHKGVLEAIENLKKNCPEDFWRRNFPPRDYMDERGKTWPMYEMTRNGFTLLAMGFTGKKAVEFKLKSHRGL